VLALVLNLSVPLADRQLFKAGSTKHEITLCCLSSWTSSIDVPSVVSLLEIGESYATQM
jgi:hypothetical protein